MPSSGQYAHPTLVVRERKRFAEDATQVEQPGAGAVLGNYRLIQEIGSGGVGRVFLAEHVLLGRRVALKMLRAELSKNEKLVKRFFTEARTVNEIQHENIVA